MNNKNNKKKVTKPQKNAGSFVIWMFMILGMLYVFNVINQGFEKPVQELTYSKFFEMLKENPT